MFVRNTSQCQQMQEKKKAFHFLRRKLDYLTRNRVMSSEATLVWGWWASRERQLGVNVNYGFLVELC